MPTISQFFGIVIQRFWREHSTPHFHALYGEFEALINIRTLEVIGGSLPRRALALAIEWAIEHPIYLQWHILNSPWSPSQTVLTFTQLKGAASHCLLAHTLYPFHRAQNPKSLCNSILVN